MQIFKFIGIAIVVIIGLIVCFLFFLQYRTQHDPREQEFLLGKAPTELPDGFYQGAVNVQGTGWLGKKFDRVHRSGINVFQTRSGTNENAPFMMSLALSGVEKNLRVLRVDYNVPQNPWYLRLVVDELVEVSPGHFLGKLNLRILPNLWFPVGYFELQK